MAPLTPSLVELPGFFLLLLSSFLLLSSLLLSPGGVSLPSVFVQPPTVLLSTLLVLLTLLFPLFGRLPLRPFLKFAALGGRPLLCPLFQLSTFLEALLFPPFCSDVPVHLLFGPAPCLPVLLLSLQAGLLLGPRF